MGAPSGQRNGHMKEQEACDVLAQGVCGRPGRPLVYAFFLARVRGGMIDVHKASIFPASTL